MEETLKILSNYQIQALHKGISFDIDMTVNSNNTSSARVSMRYSVAGDISKGFSFDTTFSDSSRPLEDRKKFNNIEHYITTITGPIEQK